MALGRISGTGDFAANPPIALQLVGAPFSENLLLGIGREFQARTDWHKRRPPE
jgi:aspartyl-tRNA(Asn)/glutamyl-tRNA(Gln) amidotransferase subunit A